MAKMTKMAIHEDELYPMFHLVKPEPKDGEITERGQVVNISENKLKGVYQVHEEFWKVQKYLKKRSDDCIARKSARWVPNSYTEQQYSAEDMRSREGWDEPEEFHSHALDKFMNEQPWNQEETND